MPEIPMNIIRIETQSGFSDLKKKIYVDSRHGGCSWLLDFIGCCMLGNNGLKNHRSAH